MKLSPPAVKIIRRFSGRLYQWDIARIFKINQSTVSRVINRVTWRDVR